MVLRNEKELALRWLSCELEALGVGVLCGKGRGCAIRGWHQGHHPGAGQAPVQLLGRHDVEHLGASVHLDVAACVLLAPAQAQHPLASV